MVEKVGDKLPPLDSEEMIPSQSYWNDGRIEVEDVHVGKLVVYKGMRLMPVVAFNGCEGCILRGIMNNDFEGTGCNPKVMSCLGPKRDDSESIIYRHYEEDGSSCTNCAFSSESKTKHFLKCDISQRRLTDNSRVCDRWERKKGSKKI